MDDEDRKRQAEVLALIADQLPWTTIAEWNAQRFTADVLAPEIEKLRAEIIIPEDPRCRLADEAEFDQLVVELYLDGHCILPKSDWTN